MSDLTPEQLDVLMKDLNPSRVSKRKQGGRDLSYLEAWDVKATLIRVFGFLGFSAECIESEVLAVNHNENAKDTKGQTYTQIEALAKCTVRLTLLQSGATYTETAAASQKGRDVGEVVDFALKTAESDALKRAAIYLGTQFGLSLYDQGTTKEVIKKIVAPGQTWPIAKPLDDKQKQMLAETLGATEVPNSELGA